MCVDILVCVGQKISGHQSGIKLLVEKKVEKILNNSSITKQSTNISGKKSDLKTAFFGLPELMTILGLKISSLLQRFVLKLESLGMTLSTGYTKLSGSKMTGTFISTCCS